MKKLILAVILFWPLNADAALIDSLVSYWKLDDASGDAIDSHGSNDGTLFGPTQGATGKIGDAYSFDGGDWISIPVTASGTPFSVTAWVKSTSIAALQDVWSEAESSTDMGDVFRLSLGGTVAGDPVQATLRNGGSWESADTTSGYTTGWHFVSVVFTNSTSRTVYIDGGNAGTNVVLRDPVNMNVSAIGRLSRLNPASYFIGAIDEVAVWNKALSPAEITELYNGGNGLTYPFDANALFFGTTF